MSQIFRESVLFEGAPSVDTDAGVVRGVKLLGKVSSNGREYSDSAMEQAAKLYEGVDVYVNHPDKSTPNAERKYEDRLGLIKNVRVTESGVYGDFDYLKSHPVAAQFVESVERQPQKTGFSHNSQGRLKRKGNKWVVESIESVRSVDLVANPATTNGIFESRDSTMTKTVREIVKAGKNKTLFELLEDDAMDAMGDAPAEVSPADSDEDKMRSAFMAALSACLDEPDKASAAAKAKKLINAYFGLQDEGDAGELPPEMSGDTAESKKHKPSAELAALREELESYRARDNVRALAAAASVTLTDVQIKAASLLESADRKAFIESLPKAAAGKQLPAVSPPKSIFESRSNEGLPPSDPKKFAAFVRN